jgi:glucose/arabinose dehydrogenase
MSRRLAAMLIGGLALGACASDSAEPGVDLSTVSLPGASLPGVTVESSPRASLQPFLDVSGVVDIAVRPGEPALYLVRQDGEVLRVDPASGSNETVLDIGDLTRGAGERGLLGLAFHPTEPLAYINYTRASGGDTVVAEFAVDSSGTFDPGSRREVLTIDQPHSNHNGGGLAFGPDAMLYIGTGDGGSAGDPDRRSLDLGDLLGKMLRIDPLASGPQPYTVPVDNPFVGVEGARPELWGTGLRNPWRFGFDPANGDLWIADLGQNALEEVNRSTADADGLRAGRAVNYGWSAFEGTARFNTDQPAEGATPPVFEYPHGDLGCSISGGAVYRGAALPSLIGWYVYGDYCSGQVRALQVGAVSTVDVPLAQTSAVVAVKPGPDGELYVASIDDGVFRLVAP